MLKMKFTAIICLLLSLYVEFIATTPCVNNKVQVEVKNSIHLTGDGAFQSDIYVMLCLGNQTLTNRVIDSSSNPNWWETLTFDPTSSDILTVEVWDEDGGFKGDDDLGICTEELSENATPKNMICLVPEDGLVNLQYKCK